MENRFPSRSAIPTTPLTTISTRSTGKIGSTMTDPQVLGVLDHEAPTALGGNGLSGSPAAQQPPKGSKLK